MATRKLKPSFSCSVSCPYCTLFKLRLVGLVLQACVCAYSIVPDLRFGGSHACQKTHNQTGCDGYIPIKGVPSFLVMEKIWLFNIHIYLVYSSTTISLWKTVLCSLLCCIVRPGTCKNRKTGSIVTA